MAPEMAAPEQEQVAAESDPLMRWLHEFPAKPGRSSLDMAEAKGALNPHILRRYAVRVDDSYDEAAVEPGALLAKGAPVGLCEDGKARHIRPHKARQRFIGFVQGWVEGDRVRLRSRGSVALPVRDLRPGDEGRNVYAEDVDTFTLTPNNVLVGIVKQIESDGLALVLFRQFNDDRPFKDAPLPKF